MKERDETARLAAMHAWERRLRRQGLALIAGVDEAGRGPLAGPVTAAAVILPADLFLPGLNDSKQVPPGLRVSLAAAIKSQALAWAVGWASVAEIDSLNILAAARLAMRRALAALAIRPDHVLTDAVSLPGLPVGVTPLIGGDALSASIAAASILAKTARDELMAAYDSLFPQYGFSRHKGYPTPDHWEAIDRYGVTILHRRSFAGLAENNAYFQKRDLFISSE